MGLRDPAQLVPHGMGGAVIKQMLDGSFPREGSKEKQSSQSIEGRARSPAVEAMKGL